MATLTNHHRARPLCTFIEVCPLFLFNLACSRRARRGAKGVRGCRVLLDNLQVAHEINTSVGLPLIAIASAFLPPACQLCLHRMRSRFACSGLGSNVHAGLTGAPSAGRCNGLGRWCLGLFVLAACIAAVVLHNSFAGFAIRRFPCRLRNTALLPATGGVGGGGGGAGVLSGGHSRWGCTPPPHSLPALIGRDEL